MSEDLISRSAFEKFIKEKYEDGESTDDIKDQMLFDLSYQPTAYNVDKVVEKLEEAKSMVPVNRLLDDIIHDKSKELGQLMAYNKAINIVKAGGVE